MANESFDHFGQVRALVEDLFQIREGWYWLDLGVCTVLGWGGFIYAVNPVHQGAVVFVLAFILSMAAFYRALVFIHEITHVRSAQLAAFTGVWNIVCGFFAFFPHYIYLCHGYHHRVNSFSTKTDPEYLPLAHQKPFQILAPFLIFPLVPLLLAFRFLIVGPLSILLGGRCRDWVLRHCSSIKLNVHFEWVTITPEERRLSVIQDLACLAWWGVFLAGCAREGVLFRAIVVWWALMYTLQCINHFRSLISHRYTNLKGDKVSYEEQLLDSITIDGFSPTAMILAPVGLRYHSLHHLFPTMPYHSLGAAHRRLVQKLPKDHLYFKTLTPSFYVSMRQFLGLIFANGKRPPEPSGIHLIHEK
jgi:fatty acid desaturase